MISCFSAEFNLLSYIFINRFFFKSSAYFGSVRYFNLFIEFRFWPLLLEFKFFIERSLFICARICSHQFQFSVIYLNLVILVLFLYLISCSISVHLFVALHEFSPYNHHIFHRCKCALTSIVRIISLFAQFFSRHSYKIFSQPFSTDERVRFAHFFFFPFFWSQSFTHCTCLIVSFLSLIRFQSCYDFHSSSFPTTNRIQFFILNFQIILCFRLFVIFWQFKSVFVFNFFATFQLISKFFSFLRSRSFWNSWFLHCFTFFFQNVKKKFFQLHICIVHCQFFFQLFKFQKF